MSARDLQQRLGSRLQELRTAAGLTQELLAERAGITWHFVSAIERGTKGATVETLAGLASALNVSLSELFLDIDRPIPREYKRLATALAGHDGTTQQCILTLVGNALMLADASRVGTSARSGLRAAEPRRLPRR